jgi:hypothetical protein
MPVQGKAPIAPNVVQPQLNINHACTRMQHHWDPNMVLPIPCPVQPDLGESSRVRSPNKSTDAPQYILCILVIMMWTTIYAFEF